MLRDLSCPTCGGPGLEAHQPDGVVVCKFCGNKFAEDGSIACPRCEAINAPEVGFCKDCGQKLKRTCLACSTENWIGAEYCAQCGQALDLLDLMADRHAHDFRANLLRQRELAKTIKAEEEAASQKRLASMWAVESRRQEELARQQTEQRRQQNVIFIVMVGLAAGVVCLIVVAIGLSVWR